MSTLARLLYVLRRGPGSRRIQAWLGVAFVLAALVWLILNLWQILLLFAGLLVGFFLIARSLRGAPPPSSSSSSS
jgi:hypothetical protein